MYKVCLLPSKKIKRIVKAVAGLLFLVVLQLSFAKQSADDQSLISISSIEAKQQQYSGRIAQRFKAWKNLILSLGNKPVSVKLRAVNNFFNQFEYVDDDSYQGASDYWKTPNEFIIDGGGDCEDFSIAKYFTLLAVDIPIDTLRITYVKSLEFNKAHMILAYYPDPGAEPLILDNLMAKILPASKRKDLVPVYSFNGKGIWMPQQRGKEQALGNATRLGKWQSVVQRMQQRE